jgi:hypothetical protein
VVASVLAFEALKKYLAIKKFPDFRSKDSRKPDFDSLFMNSNCAPTLRIKDLRQGKGKISKNIHKKTD